MSRVLFLSMTEAQAVAKCDAEGVGVSALETLPGGGVRLVCMSVEGAATMNAKLKSSLISGTSRREPFRPLHARR